MILKGKDLIFISRIERDGSGTAAISSDHRKMISDEAFNMNCLSISNETWIASGFNSYVVRLTTRTRKRLYKK